MILLGQQNDLELGKMFYTKFEGLGSIISWIFRSFKILELIRITICLRQPQISDSIEYSKHILRIIFLSLQKF